MTTQRIFGVLFILLAFTLLSMGINPIRFVGDWFHGTFADRTSDMATGFFLPGVVAMVIGCFLMLFGRGKAA